MKFYKYQGTGNDFILLDNRQGNIQLTQAQIAQLCHRRMGIGADGLMLLQEKKGYDFEMVYYNADGRTSSMCGNGGRCIVQFAHDLGLIQYRATFWAIDGAHEAEIHGDGDVALLMQDVNGIHRDGKAYVLDTGSPHYVRFVEQPVEVVTEGRRVRNSPTYCEAGINVNFVQKTSAGLRVATYERGVEDETYSCGTGVTAAAIAAYLEYENLAMPIHIETKGGVLSVHFEDIHPNGATTIYLNGPATFVFEGEIKVI